MTVRSCAGNCPRLISVSAVPGGNLHALADPKHWAVNYVECTSCSMTWCDRCHTKLGSDVCPTCGVTFVHHFVAAGPAAPSPATDTTPAASPRRGWPRRLRSDGSTASAGSQSRPPLARTIAEAEVFMVLHPCACGSPEFERASREIMIAGYRATSYSGPCTSCTAWREFVFRFPELMPAPDDEIFGDGAPSELLDPGEWYWIANWYARGPGSPAGLDDADRRYARRQVAMAAAAMDEVLAFVPPRKSKVPAKLIRSQRGRELYARMPGSFSRERLQVVRDTYRGIVAEFER